MFAGKVGRPSNAAPSIPPAPGAVATPEQVALANQFKQKIKELKDLQITAAETAQALAEMRMEMYRQQMNAGRNSMGKAPIDGRMGPHANDKISDYGSNAVGWEGGLAAVKLLLLERYGTTAANLFRRAEMINLKIEAMTNRFPWSSHYEIDAINRVLKVDVKGGTLDQVAEQMWAGLQEALASGSGLDKILNDFGGVLTNSNAVQALLDSDPAFHGMGQEYRALLEEWNASVALGTSSMLKYYEGKLTDAATGFAIGATIKGVGLVAAKAKEIRARRAQVAPAAGPRRVVVTHWQDQELQRLTRTGQLTQREIEHLDTHLRTYHNARLYVDGPNIPPRFRLPDANTPGATWVLPNGEVVITLRGNTTGYFATHEYLHLLHYRQLESIYGRRTALTMWNEMSVREAEQAVYDTLRGQYWNHLTPEQQRHAAGYLMSELGGRGFAW